jgi:hypothetical protein
VWAAPPQQTWKPGPETIEHKPTQEVLPMSTPKTKMVSKVLADIGEGPFFDRPSATLSKNIYPPHHAMAFYNAAQKTLDGIAADKSRRHHDDLLFPVLYLFRHYLELQLKEFVILGLRCGDIQEDPQVEKLLGGHAIRPALWSHCKRFIVKSYKNPEKLPLVDSAVNEFHDIDPDGQSLRYDREKGTFRLRGFKKMPTRIRIPHLRTNIHDVFTALDGWYDGIIAAWTEGQS